jgi:hypothetical protein
MAAMGSVSVTAAAVSIWTTTAVDSLAVATYSSNEAPNPVARDPAAPRRLRRIPCVVGGGRCFARRLDHRHEDSVDTGVEGTLDPHRGALRHPEYRVGGFAGRLNGPDSRFRGLDCHRHVFEVDDDVSKPRRASTSAIVGCPIVRNVPRTSPARSRSGSERPIFAWEVVTPLPVSIGGLPPSGVESARAGLPVDLIRQLSNPDSCELLI